MKSLEVSRIKVHPEPQAYWKFANSFNESERRIYWEPGLAYSAPTAVTMVKRIGIPKFIKNIPLMSRGKTQICQDEVVRPFGTAGRINTAKTLHLDEARWGISA
jgi:hypothetical protein